MQHRLVDAEQAFRLAQSFECLKTLEDSQLQYKWYKSSDGTPAYLAKKKYP